MEFSSSLTAKKNTHNKTQTRDNTDTSRRLHIRRPAANESNEFNMHLRNMSHFVFQHTDTNERNNGNWWLPNFVHHHHWPLATHIPHKINSNPSINFNISRLPHETKPIIIFILTTANTQESTPHQFHHARNLPIQHPILIGTTCQILPSTTQHAVSRFLSIVQTMFRWTGGNVFVQCGYFGLYALR